MKTISFFTIVICCSVAVFANDVSKKASPSWVNNIEIANKETFDFEGGYQYLLIDLQYDLKQETRFRHYAIAVNNSDGIQAMSDITVEFDPTYQELEFHQIQIIREGQKIDKLPNSKINVIQRETNLERSLYDGALSAVINLTDVREGDIIEYSYSTRGFNPVYKGNYSNTFYHQFTTPINRVYNRIIVGADQPFYYKLLSGAVEPRKKVTSQQIEYIWDHIALENLQYDSNVPYWYDIQKRVNFSTSNRWGDVVELCRPLYDYSPFETDILKGWGADDELSELRLLAIIRFVQDEIRYLGFESGIGAYKPNSPKKVYSQRYGDCKDKSLLLVSLLRNEGIEAYPLLVNTQTKGQVSDQQPSINAFNHCIVKFKFDDKDFFLDPTISNQGGDLENIYLPAYEKGLLIKEGEDRLIDIPLKTRSITKINELITVDSIGGFATLTVRSEYAGSKADYMRSYFSSNSKESIQSDYLDYYSNLYPGIEPSLDIKMLDFNRNSSNKLIVEEFYLVKDFWRDSDDSSYIYGEVYPLVLESSMNYSSSASRSMPFFLGQPFQFEQTTRVDLPEDWSVDEEEVSIEGEGFSYFNRIEGEGSAVIVTHKYTLSKEFIAGEFVDSFQKKHEDIQNELSFYLTYNKQLSDFRLSWISVVIALFALTLGVFFCNRIYRRYDPEPWEFAEDKPVGGWLILPAIGLTITPIIYLFSILSEDFFDHNIWIVSTKEDLSTSVSLTALIAGELVINIMLFAFSILLIVLFYQRRTSLPRLISIFYVLSFLVPLIDSLLADEVLKGQISEEENESTYRGVLRGVITAAIWIPYFNIAERVKSTFCKQRTS